MREKCDFVLYLGINHSFIAIKHSLRGAYHKPKSPVKWSGSVFIIPEAFASKIYGINRGCSEEAASSVIFVS